VYVDVFDRRIVVHVGRSLERDAQAREVWRKRIRVTGMIRRNPETGSAIDITNVTDLQIAEPKIEGALLRGQGAIHWRYGDELPEVTIRRIRDGE
jgi:hypothetical protein